MTFRRSLHDSAASLALALLASFGHLACGSAALPATPPSPVECADGGDAGDGGCVPCSDPFSDGGGCWDGGCVALLDGLGGLPDGGLLALQDAGYSCLAQLATDGGAGSSLLLVPGADAPAGVLSAGVVVRFPQRAPDAGAYPPLQLDGGSASVALRDGRAYGWQAGATGSGKVAIDSVVDEGQRAGGLLLLEPHGSLDLTLVQVVGDVTDGGIDAGVRLRMRARF